MTYPVGYEVCGTCGDDGPHPYVEDFDSPHGDLHLVCRGCGFPVAIVNSPKRWPPWIGGEYMYEEDR